MDRFDVLGMSLIFYRRSIFEEVQSLMQRRAQLSYYSFSPRNRISNNGTEHTSGSELFISILRYRVYAGTNQFNLAQSVSHSRCIPIMPSNATGPPCRNAPHCHIEIFSHTCPGLQHSVPVLPVHSNQTVARLRHALDASGFKRRLPDLTSRDPSDLSPARNGATIQLIHCAYPPLSCISAARG